MYKEFVTCAACAALGSVEFHHLHDVCEREAETRACVLDYGLQPHGEHEQLSAEQIVEPVVAVQSVGSMPFSNFISAEPQQLPRQPMQIDDNLGMPPALRQLVTQVNSGSSA